MTTQPRPRGLPSLTLLLLTTLVAAGCGRSSAEALPARAEAAAPIAVKTAPVQRLKVPRTLMLSGSLIGAEEAQVAAGAAGKVLATYVERGSAVKKGVELTVPEADVAQIKQGLTIDFRTASDGGKVYRGRIRYVGPSVRKQTRDGVVEAVVDNAGHDLRPGMFVTAQLALGEQTLPAVPATAVREEGTLRHVFVVQNGRL